MHRFGTKAWRAAARIMDDSSMNKTHVCILHKLTHVFIPSAFSRLVSTFKFRFVGIRNAVYTRWVKWHLEVLNAMPGLCLCSNVNPLEPIIFLKIFIRAYNLLKLLRLLVVVGKGSSEPVRPIVGTVVFICLRQFCVPMLEAYLCFSWWAELWSCSVQSWST
jgi:hypothetical protein